MEFKTNFTILFIGNINIRPNKNRKHIQVIYTDLDHKEKLADEEIRRLIRCYKRESQV